MKHISTQEWSRSGVQIPRQLQAPLDATISNEDGGEMCSANGSFSEDAFQLDDSGADCENYCVKAQAQRALYHSKCFLLVIELVSTFFEVSAGSLQGRTRGAAPVCQARQICMYLLHTSLSLSYPEIGDLFCRDRTTISHACMVVEDLRDNTSIDKNLVRLESILTTIVSLVKDTEFPAPGDVQ